MIRDDVCINETFVTERGRQRADRHTERPGENNPWDFLVPSIQ